MLDDGFCKVCWFRRGQEIARNAFDHLLPAKQFAQDRLHIQKVRKGVDHVRVIEADGVGYFDFGFSARYHEKYDISSFL